MPLLPWNAKLEVGHSQIDSDHKKLVELLNRLHDAMQAGQARDVCGRILDELIQYTRVHFATEERLMAQHGYAQAATHKAQHASLVQEVVQFKSRFDAGSIALSVSLFKFLKDWLSNHILQSDKTLVAALNAKA
jgi:hemerythrin-like metal-binding protein